MVLDDGLPRSVVATITRWKGLQSALHQEMETIHYGQYRWRIKKNGIAFFIRINVSETQLNQKPFNFTHFF